MQVAAKNAAGAANQCITSSQGASKHNTNKQSQNQLNSDCAVVNSHIPALIQGVKQSAANPDNPSAQLHLINVSQQFIQVCENNFSVKDIYIFHIFFLIKINQQR